MNPRYLFALFGASFLANALPAQDTNTASAVHWTVTAPVVSQYMFRGVRLGGASFQPSVEAGYGDLALGLWTSFPLANRVPGQSDPEIDPYGSYKWTLSESLSIQPGFTWYTYPRAEERNGFYRSTFEPNLAVNYTVAGVTLTPRVYYDMVLDGATLELSAAYALPLKQLGTELDFLGTVGTYRWKSAWADTTPDMKNWGDYWLVGVSLPFQVTTSSKLLVGFAYTKGSNSYLKQGTSPRFVNEAAVGRGVVTLSYAIIF